MLNALKKLFGGRSQPPAPVRRSRPPVEPESEPEVPEVMASELMAERNAGAPLLLLDCREDHERRQVHIPEDLHIPMNEVPGRLQEIEARVEDKATPIVVYCASGMRSYGVAHFLNEQGFNARSLEGGIARWQMAKGPVVTTQA